MTSSFIHFRTHSSFSILEAALSIETLVRLALTEEMPAMALTDTHNLFGAFSFSALCVSRGIQPILGCQLSLSLAEEKYHRHTTFYDFPLIVRTIEGYQNLIFLSSQAYRHAKENGSAPFITWKDLQNHTKGLAALTGGPKGAIDCFVLKEEERAKTHLEKMHVLFQDNLYIELVRQEMTYEEKIETTLIEWAFNKSLPLLATNPTYFEHKNMTEAHEALLCIADGTYMMSLERRLSTPDFRFKSSSEMKELFATIPEALHNTQTLAQRCAYYIHPSKPMMPTTHISGKEDSVLEKQAQQGLKQRFSTMNNIEEEKRTRYQKRLCKELSVIQKMGFSGYFLIVADFVQWAKKQNIPVGPGRGSGAASLVAWSLTITDVDPIYYDLIFERFLNPERVSLPDFDIDFCQERRDEVITYVQQKYGEDRVAQIITFGTLQARAVLRDVGRVLQMPYPQVDYLSKLIPFHPTHPISLTKAIEQEDELKKRRNTDSTVDKLLNISLMLEGLYRHASTHAAGIVIGRDPLEQHMPLYYDPRSTMPATQFNMKDVEKLGLVKFDFLGLKTLTLISKTCKLLEQNDQHIDISKVPMDDPPTFTLLQSAQTFGVFQFESTGMRDVLRQLQPTRFEELIALTALYRPGPMDDIPRYLACKHGKEEVKHLHPLMAPILEETFGVMVYQEQVMQIAQKLAGYSLASADLLRRSMGKKIKSEMVAQRKQFVQGCHQHNKITPQIANQVFDVMEKFASYGFPKGHATPYGLLSYQTAYLKANFPVAFFAASMTLDMHNTDKIILHKAELERLKIPLLGPDINTSFAHFTMTKDKKTIRYGLAGIKNVGAASMQDAVAERERNGLFKTIFDFAHRVPNKCLNKRQMEKLIYAGAFDTLHTNRHELFANLEHILKVSSTTQTSQVSLFDHQTDAAIRQEYQLVATLPWKNLELAQKEFDAFGFFLTQHPLQMLGGYLVHSHITTANQLTALLSSEGKKDEKQIGRNEKKTRKKARPSSHNGRRTNRQTREGQQKWSTICFSTAIRCNRAF